MRRVTKEICRAEIERLEHLLNVTGISLGIAREHFGHTSMLALSMARAALEISHSLDTWRGEYQYMLEKGQR